jgi:hypothetical protein
VSILRAGSFAGRLCLSARNRPHGGLAEAAAAFEQLFAVVHTAPPTPRL